MDSLGAIYNCHDFQFYAHGYYLLVTWVICLEHLLLMWESKDWPDEIKPRMVSAMVTFSSSLLLAPISIIHLSITKARSQYPLSICPSPRQGVKEHQRKARNPPKGVSLEPICLPTICMKVCKCCNLPSIGF